MKKKKKLTRLWKHKGILWSSSKMRNKKKKEDKKGPIRPWEYNSVSWLVSKRFKHFSEEVLFFDVISKCRSKEWHTLYHNINVQKPEGGYRTISIPDPKLLKVQKAINKYVLRGIPSHPSAFGFSGGSIIDAIEPHLKNKVLYSFDIVDAFGQVDHKHTWKQLNRSLSEPITDIIIYDLGFWWTEKHPVKLPQGSALSPRLFDIAFYPTDVRLDRLAKKFGGTYTRYADNIFFSLPTKNFHKKLQSAVLGRMRWLDGGGTRIKCHKFSVRRLDKGAVRILGLNIINGKISATREYKRNIRLAIHHINYLLDNGKHPQAYSEWLNLKGRMSFAKLGILPKSLIESYSKLEKIIEIRDLERVVKSYIKLFDDEIQSEPKERIEDE
jgi:hypothetical protein